MLPNKARAHAVNLGYIGSLQFFLAYQVVRGIGFGYCPHPVKVYNMDKIMGSIR